MSEITRIAVENDWAGVAYCRKCRETVLTDTEIDGTAPIVECGRCAKFGTAVIIRHRGRNISAPQSHTVYRMWGAAGQLLYIGVTSRIENRLSAHRRHKPWTEIEIITLAHYDTRPAAEAAELTAIRNERPLWNGRGNQ